MHMTMKEVVESSASHVFLQEPAWLLVTCPNPALRETGQVISVARKAIGELKESKPQLFRNQQARGWWRILGVGHYQNGEYVEAIAALEKALECYKLGDCAEWSFLAMAHAKLGQQDVARKWYEEAARWIEERDIYNEELRRFQQEAAELMGIRQTGR
jgi:tetratricopeptide (TPR) repeat protein